MSDARMSGESRLERGRRALAAIDGAAGEAVVTALADIAPDFATYLFEFPSATSIRARASACASARSRPLPPSPRWAPRRRS